MEIFLKYNKKQIHDRQIDTLIGLAKGITVDGDVDLEEAMFLQNWLVQNCHSPNPIIINLLHKVSAMLEDDILDKDESKELFSILHSITGAETSLGEAAKTTKLPICSPTPKISFSSKVFLFTGTCAYGTRKQCQEVITSLDGINAKSVTKKLDYLVLGTYVTECWAHETFGRKIEKAMTYRDSGLPISIITEEHLMQETNL